MRAREEKYWAEKQQQGDEEAEAEAAGDGNRKGSNEEVEQQQQQQEQGAPAAEQALAEAAAVSARGGPLSAELLERVARAKEAERARRVHEALAVVEMARWVLGLGWDGVLSMCSYLLMDISRNSDWIGLDWMHTYVRTGGGSRHGGGSSWPASPRHRTSCTWTCACVDVQTSIVDT